jgi:hypothetical protein
MSIDQNRINNIENNLKNSPEAVSNNDLFYYLNYTTKNDKISSTNLNDTENYLKKIENVYRYENIYTNPSNYGSTVPIIIGLLLPFYYTYPRFYKLGLLGLFIGFGSFLSLYQKIEGLFGFFFNKIGLWFLITTFTFYIVFFILLNKLNHISLFFISAIISYIFINYICRLILTSPIKNSSGGDYSQFNHFRSIENEREGYSDYNLLIETTCNEVISRYKMPISDPTILYSYLTEFDIKDNDSIISDFYINLFGPLVSLGFLFLIGYFLSLFKDTTIQNVKNNPIELFPIIGINNYSDQYFTCQANYILPKEIHCNLLIHDFLDKYNFDDNVYNKLQKSLLRISDQLLIKYNPKFTRFKETNVVFDNLKGYKNKILLEIEKVLRKTNSSLNDIKDKNGKYSIEKIYDIIYKEDFVPYKTKEDMYDLLYHINDTLKIVYDYNDTYENDLFLAKEVLLADKDIDKDYMLILDKVVHKYIKLFRQNLGYLEKNEIEKKYGINDVNNMYLPIPKEKIYYVNKKLDENILFGYHYNILGYPIFGTFNNTIRKISNKTQIICNLIFKNILRIFSSWLLLAKPIGSAWLISKYMLINSFGFKKILKYMSNKSILWKYFSTGLDTSYFEDTYKVVKNNNQNSILSRGLNLLYSILLTLFVMMPLLGFYNTVNFGYTLNPSWTNLLCQFIFYINIIGNIFIFFNKKSFLKYNLIFLFSLIIIIIIISLIIYFFG